MTNTRFFSLASLAMVALLSGGPGAASGGWVASGWSGFVDTDRLTGGIQTTPALADGNVNFAVYQAGDSDWTDDFGGAFGSALTALSGSVASSAPFVYFYQIVNSDIVTPELAFKRFRLAIEDQAFVSSYGFVDRYVFNDSDSTPITGANDELGATVANGLPTGGDEASNGLATVLSPGFLGDTATPFVFNASAKNPIDHPDERTSTILGEVIEFQWTDGAAQLRPNEYSSIFFVTGQGPPTLRTSQLSIDGRTFNEVLSPTPVPPALTLVFSGILTFGIGALIRRCRGS